MFDLWHLYRRRLLIGGAFLAALLIMLGVSAIVVRAGAPSTRTTPAAASTTPLPAPSIERAPSAPATDVRSWDAMPPVKPEVSAEYPAIGPHATDDPTAFAVAFAVRLFTRDYRRSTREQLSAWAQYEDAPLRSPNYPREDWSKVLVDSLTDLTWDNATDTPIPAEGPWLALHAEHGRQTVSDVKAQLDPRWESAVAGGYRPDDPLATVRDVTLTITQYVLQSGKPRVTRYAVSLAIQLGSSPRGGYGAAATNNYVIKESS